MHTHTHACAHTHMHRQDGVFEDYPGAQAQVGKGRLIGAHVCVFVFACLCVCVCVYVICLMGGKWRMCPVGDVDVCRTLPLFYMYRSIHIVVVC